MAGNGIAMTEQDVTDGIGLLMEQISSLTDSSMAGELASGGPRLKVQVSSFRNAVREVFGADSHEFSEFGTLEMFGGPLRVGMSSTELHAARVKGRDHMVEVARELIQRLQRRLSVGAPSSTESMLPTRRSAPSSCSDRRLQAGCRR